MLALIEWVKLNKGKVIAVVGAAVVAVSATAAEHTVAYKVAVAVGKFLASVGGAQ